MEEGVTKGHNRRELQRGKRYNQVLKKIHNPLIETSHQILNRTNFKKTCLMILRNCC